jgi:hypothetical protein
LHTCPVLDVKTSSAELVVFDQCYGLEAGWGRPTRFERQSLPTRGGVLDQPAKLMDALAVIANVTNDELDSVMKDAQRKVEKDV